MNCKHCKQPFTRIRPLQSVCSPKCAQALAKTKRERQEARETRAKLKAFERLPKLIADAQSAVNSYVKWRDYFLPCISCGTARSDEYGKKRDCGHYRSRGSAPHLRFHLHNMAMQCVHDNRDLAGAPHEFRIGLIARIGLPKVEAIERDQEPRKYSKEYVTRLKKVFLKKARRQKQRVENV